MTHLERDSVVSVLCHSCCALGDEIIIASTTLNDWACQLGRLVKVAVGVDGAKNWPQLLELAPLAAYLESSEPEPEPEQPEPEPEPVVSYETSLLLDMPELFRGCKLFATATPPAKSPLETMLAACRVGPSGDDGVVVAMCCWMPREAEPTPEVEETSVVDAKPQDAADETDEEMDEIEDVP